MLGLELGLPDARTVLLKMLDARGLVFFTCTTSAKGPKGELSRTIPAAMQVSLDNGILTVARPNDEEANKALHGLARTLVANLVEGL